MLGRPDRVSDEEIKEGTGLDGNIGGSSPVALQAVGALPLPHVVPIGRLLEHSMCASLAANKEIHRARLFQDFSKASKTITMDRNTHR